jgi:hypothetical protein
VGAQHVNVGALELIERPGLSRGEQPESRIKRASLKARPSRSQRALRTPLRVHSQRDGTLQERRGRGQPSAALRTDS